MNPKMFGRLSVAAAATCLAGVIVGAYAGFCIQVVGGFALMGCGAAYLTLKQLRHA